MHRLFRALRVTLIVLLLSVSAFAQQSVSKNISLLRSSKDFRVRTQAALALGASRTRVAVEPLCDALGDENRTVRIASATALSRLKLGGRDCISAHIRTESDQRVVAALERALRNMGGAEPLIGPKTKYWVAIQKVAGPERLNRPVRAAMVGTAQGNAEVAFAPEGLPVGEAERTLDKYPGATGLLLAPRLARPRYEGGVLKIKMSVAIMTYPTSNLLGTFSKTVGMAGITAPDPGSEDELAVMAARESMKQFLALAPNFAR